ncbi:polynucleotide kinase-phosphatase [Kineococcus radiotolerans]|uniref:Metallophosphoesterase n=1 Tax=Kineococcus radiotolerans (strain ATCC BAA-149 / DSM 14245 / SRS30216) TaxID=266940 RepID=A6W794_KINRD|nr:polynucleotide kinase-phosphatase [Kineococcus radiotolerans]ABS02683.1 metallophosphoesterase [Kineococcus radiotolerans SRS30216 = ATCC BAA-149]
MTRELTVPASSLVVLVGTTGSGKSTFARANFRRTEVISSDWCRGIVSDDENDQSATKDAFEVLEFIVGKRLAANRLTVVDATNVQQSARRSLVALARAHDVLPVAIVLDLPEALCAERNRARPDRDFGPHVLRRQRAELKRSLKGLAREGFRTVHVLRDPAEVDDVTVTRTRLHTDRRDETGPFDVVGDVHGCREELVDLLGRLGYDLVLDAEGRAVDAVAPAGRRAVFVGDLVDRGPDTPGVLRLVMGMVASGTALCVPGNHEDKLLRALRGRDVQVTHGLAESLEQLAREPEEFRAQVVAFLDSLVSHYVLDGGNLAVAHAGVLERYQGRASGRVRDFCLYGQTTGETDEFGLPVRYPWAEDYRGRATVVYGHTPVPAPEWVNGTLCVDTGCVFGGHLTALRYPERELVSVPARAVHHEPARPFPVAGTGAVMVAEPEAATRRDPDVLDVTDVLGRRVVETADHGRISVREENAAAALEVVSRFAIDPRWLLHLPPTTAPVATSAREGFLEHPDEAFAAFAAEGVRAVVCEEKHMGSRALALVCRDERVAAQRFGAPGGARGAVWTRTGRSFFDPATTAVLVDELRAALEGAGVFDELGSGWVLLDGELLPWSAKAGPLLREQYASVGAAGRSALPFATGVLEQAAGRGLDVGGLLSRTAARAGDVAAFTDAYRRYCWPTDGLDGVQLAPFAVLAAEGASFADRPHDWHLDLADRLVGTARAAGSDRLRPTRRLVVDTADATSTAAGVAWWEELTGAGGEGMVVKPLANRVRTRRGLVQPALKVRGREYLRIVYGPSYTEPANLERLRQRTLGRKRSLALREYALGLEGLERVARAEPLHRVHECVFAVLALESEPVDPRL